MKELIIIYIVAQLLSTAYGLSVIETVRPLVNKKLIDEGYILRKKNSMYKFNEGMTNFLKGFIPFYYAIKAYNLTKNDDPVYVASRNEIRDGNYITRDELEEEMAREELAKSIGKPKLVSEPVVGFEKPEKYVARRNGLELLNTHEEDVKYEIKRDDSLSITPFEGSIQVVKETVKEPEKKDIVKAIMDLDTNELEQLEQTVRELVNLKRKSRILKLVDTKENI